jgi:hypothetical protein
LHFSRYVVHSDNFDREVTTVFQRLTAELLDLELHEEGIGDALLANRIHSGTCCCTCCCGAP